jgi:hypothetical protein
MRVILAMHGPHIQKHKDQFIRLVDIYPMFLEWFGLDVDQDNFSGRIQPGTEINTTEQRLAGILNNPSIYADGEVKNLIDSEISKTKLVNAKLTGLQDSLPNSDLIDKRLSGIFRWQIGRQLEINKRYLKKLKDI